MKFKPATKGGSGGQVRPFNVRVAEYFRDHIPAIILGEVVYKTHAYLTNESLRTTHEKKPEVIIENICGAVTVYVKLCDNVRKTKFNPMSPASFTNAVNALLDAELINKETKTRGSHTYYSINLNSPLLKETYSNDKAMSAVWKLNNIVNNSNKTALPYTLTPIHRVVVHQNSWGAGIILCAFHYIMNKKDHRIVVIDGHKWLVLGDDELVEIFPWIDNIKLFMNRKMFSGELPALIRHEKVHNAIRLNTETGCYMINFGGKNSEEVAGVLGKKISQKHKVENKVKTEKMENSTNPNEKGDTKKIKTYTFESFSYYKNKIYKIYKIYKKDRKENIFIKLAAFEKTERQKKQKTEILKTQKSKEKNNSFKEIFFLQFKSSKIFKNFLEGTILQIIKEKNFLKNFQDEKNISDFSACPELQKTSPLPMTVFPEFLIVCDAADDFLSGLPAFMHKYPVLSDMYKTLPASDFIGCLFDWFMADPGRGIPPALISRLQKELNTRKTIPLFLHMSKSAMCRMAYYLIFLEYPEPLQAAMLSGLTSALAHDDIKNPTAFFVDALRSRVTLEHNRDILTIEGTDFPVFTVYPTPVPLHRTYCLVDLPMLVPEFQEFMDSISTWDTPEDIYAGCLYFREMHRRTYEYHRSLPCLHEFIGKT